MSIVAGFAVMTISYNRNSQIEQAAKQLKNVITLAEEEAILQSTTFGLAFTQNSFQFYQYQEKKRQWQPLTGRTYGLRRLANNIKISLHIQNVKVDLTGKPQIIISPSGDITPFKILLGRDTPLYQVLGEANGSVTSVRIP